MRSFMRHTGYKDHGRILQKRSSRAVLRDATVRDFSGGWNIVDSELNLSSKFQIVSDNIVREEDGSLGIRYGTALLKEFGARDDVVNMVYFLDQLVCVHADGAVSGTYADGTTYTITTAWKDEAIPAYVCDFACFAFFKNELIITNGINKPLRVWTDDVLATPIVLDGGYLMNPNTVSNANVPIARYVITHSQYLVFGNSVSAGASSDIGPNWLHISAKGAPGVFAADYDPGDVAGTGYASTATDVDIGQWGVQSDQWVTGLNTYRDKLVVGTPNAVLLGTFGTLNVSAEGTDLHVPDFSDVLDGVGVHSHRSMVNTGNDLLFVDHIGVVSLQKSLYSGDVEPKRVSELIDPKLSANVERLTQKTMDTECFAVYNTREKQYMLFLPNRDPSEPFIELPDNPVFIDEDEDDILHINFPSHGLEVGEYIAIDGMTSFNTVDAADYNGSTFPVLRVIDENNITIQAVDAVNLSDPATFGGGNAMTATPQFTETFGYIYTDIRSLKVKSWTRYRNWRWHAACQSELSTIFFAIEKQIFRFGNSNAPIYQDFEGDIDTPIPWAVEFPWADLDTRMKEKLTRYIAMDTTGDDTFDLMMFVDELYKRVGALIPNNIMTFAGGDSAGYGDGSQSFGGGIHTADERLTAWPARFKLMKLRLQGESTRPLRIVSISLAYQSGDYRR